MAERPVTGTLRFPPPPPRPVVLAPRAPPLLVGAQVRGGVGISADHPRFGAGAEVSIAVLDPLRAVVAVGAAMVLPNRRRDGFEISYTALAASAGVGLRFPEQSWEARLLGGAETYFVRGSEGIDGEIDVLPNLELAFQYGFGLGASLELELGVTATAYFRQKRFTVNEQPILTTERAAAALTLGLAWGAP
jgi:hypothetical protein